MYVLKVTDNFAQDLAAIQAVSPYTAAYIRVIIEVLKDDSDLLSELSVKHFINYDEPEFDIDTWVKAEREGYNLWRLKPLERARGYRLIYHYKGYGGSNDIYMLGIMDRELNYETRIEFTQRIYDTYDQFGLRHLTRR